MAEIIHTTLVMVIIINFFIFLINFFMDVNYLFTKGIIFVHTNMS